ncbi:MAG: AAA family ATPase, partial [Pirellulaceae bacterium]
MAADSQDDLLERLARPDGDAQVWESVAATRPQHELADEEGCASSADPTLEALLERIHHLTDKRPEPGVPAETVQAEPAQPLESKPESVAPREQAKTFLPAEPRSFRDAGLTESAVESLVVKFLLSRGDAAGRTIADQIKLPFVIVDELLRQMKFDHLLVYRDSAPMSDYIYQLTDVGRERARRLAEHCTYFGAAPVPLKAYCESVAAQSLVGKQPTEEDLRRA